MSNMSALGKYWRAIQIRSGLFSRDFDNQRKIRQYLEHMNWIELSSNIDKDFSMVKTGRGMEHYKNALIWSKVFLKKESFSSFSGDTIAFAILYPMEKLFECFVEWWLEKRYSHLQIEAQNGGVDFVKKLFTVRPDFLIKKDKQESSNINKPNNI